MGMHLTVVTPNRVFFDDEIARVTIPGEEGIIGVLPGHSPLLSTVRVGIIDMLTESGESLSLFVPGGIVEIMPDNVTILADYLETIEEIDIQRAEMAKARAEERLVFRHNVDIDRARAALQRAMTRLRLAARGPRTIT